MKYKETKITDLKDATYLCAIKDVATYTLYIKKHIDVGDDGEWGYKLNKAINPFRQDLEDLAEMKIETHNNNYFGELSLERLVKEFEDFYWLVSCISPLGEEESRFVIAYEFLENKIKEKKQKDFPNEVKRNYYWDDINQSIKNVSKNRYESGHYADAVESAFKEVIKRLKDYVNPIIGVTPKLDGDKLVQRAFGCENQQPVIKFNSLETDEEKDEQRGLMNLFKGIVGIRNRKAHENVSLDNKYRALEYLALASLLMGLLDEYAV